MPYLHDMTCPIIFDRLQLRRQRDRAARQGEDYGFLFRESADRLADRLSDVKRRFPLALDLGSRKGVMAATLDGRGGIETLIQSDISPAMARLAPGLRCVADEEALPFADGCFDLILSNLCLHWVNDLPGTLTQIWHCLKPDGLFLAALLGGETLGELRTAFVEAELEMEGGASPRVSPFVDVKDAGALLQRAGFVLPVVDCDTVTVTYDNAFKLLADLRGMGEGNAVDARRRLPTRRATMLRAAEIYEGRHRGADRRMPATFQILTLTGWRPAQEG